MRPIWYPEIPEDMPGTRSAPHEDINLITLLPAATKTGLQILSRRGVGVGPLPLIARRLKRVIRPFPAIYRPAWRGVDDRLSPGPAP